MPRTIQHAKLESPTARAKLKRSREAHKQTLIAGKAALGYVRQDATAGRWSLRRYMGGKRYVTVPLGLADDLTKADGVGVLSYQQAKKAATDKLEQSQDGVAKGTLTVRKAFARYIEYLAHEGKSTLFTEQRAAAVILPELGDDLVHELTADRLRKWLFKLAATPALLRSSKKAGKKRNTKPKPDDEETIRKRRSTANRILTMLKAALNHAFDEGLVHSNHAWGRRLKPFRGVDAARVRYLQIDEAKRLLNGSPPPWRKMVQAALQTGARYGELCRLHVEDFNRDAGTVHIRKTKSYKARHIVLSAEGVAFFRETTTGRPGSDFMLINVDRQERRLVKECAQLEPHGKNPNKAHIDDDGQWKASEQERPMRAASAAAKIEPAINFHCMRHTWASHAVMNGVPLIVVAKNLGHKDTRMVEHHYGHLAPGFIADAIRAGAPRFGFMPEKKVVAIAAE